ncbi:hypothetical protein CDD80_5615 [Ophiocordyceps camponoti-rufipedis]|uniref:Uncharacterized protein n=1 Tax=Ophiocordyceps camponoti-rufipedis TaxID=2004952 RepID=A0A2C5XFY1_9HYPO|nr:hypothetical protein CDD80_5615 [Ophiocordyceps camponoti-rufipedis]
MPILFGPKRHATPAPPLTWETAAPDAASAAASAFRRRETNLSASSSAAAAAAALRARPMSPTNVSLVQPKRAQRRSPSVSSLMGRDGIKARHVQRSPSVCSMVERSFRSPSPGGRNRLPQDSDISVDPKLPEITMSKADVKPVGGKTNNGKTNNSGAPPLQTQTFRTASQRLKEGRVGSWFGGATTRDVSNARKRSSSMTITKTDVLDGPGSNAAAIPARTDTSEVGDAKPARHRSVSAKLESEKTGPTKAESAGPVKPGSQVSSRRLLPRRQNLGRSQSVRESTDKPRSLRQGLSRAGSHLSRGTTNKADQTEAPALQTLRPVEPQPEPSPTKATSQEPQEPIKKKKKKKKSTTTTTKTGQNGKKGQIEAPAPVPIERQAAPGDSQATLDNSQDSQATLGEPAPQLSSKPPKLELPFHFSGDEDQREEVAKADVQTDEVVNGRAKSPPPVKRQNRTRVTRETSESPARSARFAPSTSQPLVRHEPPPRSVSPIKSAMKTPHPKDAPVVSEESDMSDEDGTTGARKKSARVSWDDNTLVVSGPESSDPHLSPSRAKEQASVGEDETMTPRPALPLFGSVRDKKCRDLEERPLVRPTGRTRSQSASDTAEPEPTSYTQEHGSGNDTKIYKCREPVPVVVDRPARDDVRAAQVSDDDLDSDAETETEALHRADPSPPRLEPLPLTAKPGPARDHGSRPADHDIIDDDDRVSEISNEEDSAEQTTGRSGEPLPPGATNPMEDIQEEDDETDRCSVYSDACEVLSPYQSIDDGLHSSAAAVGSFLMGKQASRSPNDWENAKSYWKSLTPDQRRQLEVEAMAEDTTADASKGSVKDTSSERSYQIKPGTRWMDDDAPPVPPKPSMEWLEAAAQSPLPTTSWPPRPPTEQIPQPFRPDVSKPPASPSRNEQPVAGTRTMRFGGFEAVWEPKPLEGPRVGLAKLLRGVGKGSSSSVGSEALPSSAPQSATQPSFPLGAAERRNRSVDESCVPQPRRGSAGSVSSFRPSRPVAEKTARGVLSPKKEGVSTQGQSLGQAPPPPPPSSQRHGQGFSLRSSSQPTNGHAPPRATPSTAATAEAFSEEAETGGYLRQSLRGKAAPSSSSGRRTKRARGGKDSRFADSSDEDEGASSSHNFRSRFDDSSDDSDDAGSSLAQRRRAKGLARTMRRGGPPPPINTIPSRTTLTSPALTRTSSDPASPSPSPWTRTAAPHHHQQQSQEGSRGSPRRGSILTLFRRMRDSHSNPMRNTTTTNNNKALPPPPSQRRSGSTGSSRVLSAARNALSSSASSLAVASPARTRNLLVRRGEARGGVPMPRKRFSALRRMLGMQD